MLPCCKIRNHENSQARPAKCRQHRLGRAPRRAPRYETRPAVGTAAVLRHDATADEAPSRTIRPASGRTTMRCTASTRRCQVPAAPCGVRSDHSPAQGASATRRPRTAASPTRRKPMAVIWPSGASVNQAMSGLVRSRAPRPRHLAGESGRPGAAPSRSGSSRRRARPSVRACSSGTRARAGRVPTGHFPETPPRRPSRNRRQPWRRSVPGPERRRPRPRTRARRDERWSRTGPR